MKGVRSRNVYSVISRDEMSSARESDPGKFLHKHKDYVERLVRSKQGISSKGKYSTFYFAQLILPTMS